jgi:hypothetical protein
MVILDVCFPPPRRHVDQCLLPTNGHVSNGDVCHGHDKVGHHIPWHQRQSTVNPPIHTLFISQISTSATNFCMLPANFRHSLHNVTGYHNQVPAIMLGTCCKNKSEAANTPVSRSQQQLSEHSRNIASPMLCSEPNGDAVNNTRAN